MALLLEFFSAWIQEKLPNFDLNQIENSLKMPIHEQRIKEQISIWVESDTNCSSFF